MESQVLEKPTFDVIEVESSVLLSLSATSKVLQIVMTEIRQA